MISISSAAKEVKEFLDRYVIPQDEAKGLCVLCDHYNLCGWPARAKTTVQYQKSDSVGPRCGKTICPGWRADRRFL
jgi:ATP-dependent protease Clp ATPase subunit